MSDWPSSFIQFIFVSTRLRRWYPLQRRHRVRPRYRCALTASFQAMAPALVHCPAVHASMHEMGVPRLGILALWDHRISVSGGNRLVAFKRVIRPVCRNTTDDLIRKNLLQEFGQHGRITCIVCRDLDGPNFQCFLIDPNVYLTPNTSFCTAVLAGIPFAFSLGFDTGAVHCPAVVCLQTMRGDQEVQWPRGAAIRQAHFQCSLAAA